MSNRKVEVMVWVTEDSGQLKVNFEPEAVTVTKPDSKISYLINKEGSLGYTFAGAIFPKENQNPPTIVDDVSSFKIKEGGYKLSIKDSNINAGTIGIKLLLVNAEGSVLESADPQIKNEPTL